MNEPRESRLVNLSLLRSRVQGLLGAARRQGLARDPTAWVIAGTTLCAFGVMHAGEGLCRLLVPADWKSVLADRTDDLSEEEWLRRSYGNLRGRIAAGALKTGVALVIGPLVLWVFLVPRRSWFWNWHARQETSTGTEHHD